MEYIKDVLINEAVMHVLDVNAEEPVLTNTTINLNENNYKFLLDMIYKCLKREDLRYAEFKEDIKSLSIGEKVNEYFDSKCNIIETSKFIAKNMFNKIKQHGGIASCDLIVASISTEYGPMFTVMKVDYNSTFTHGIEFIDNEISINLNSIKILSKSKKVDTAAFIKPMRLASDFDFMILNTNQDNWFEELLEYQILDNERDQTKKLLIASEQFARRLDNAAEAENLRKVVRHKISNEEVVNIEDIAEKVFSGDTENIEEYKKFAEDYGVKGKVEIDREYVDHKKRMINLKIDTDMQLKVSQETYNDMSRFQVIKNVDGSINILLKNITHYIEK